MARISTGANSKQDYQTPKELIAACEQRFGKIGVDLAAHKDNHVVDRYIAPCTGPEGPLPADPNALAIDTFDQDWADLYKKYGLLWLNCPFGEIPKFSENCWKERNRGAETLLLIPYGTTTAFTQYILGKADLYLLIGRLQFIPGESFPKDCLIAHYNPNKSLSDNIVCFWDWRADVIQGCFVTDRFKIA